MIVIFHADCVDGFTAAWIASLKYPDATFVAAHYGDARPPIDKGEDVLIVDFSYPREILEELRGRAGSLRILDHHKTAAADLEGFPGATFDMNRSGARLAFDELLEQGHYAETLVSYVQDRDLWRWKLPDSSAISVYIGSVPRTFSAWEDAAKQLNHVGDQNTAILAGYAILRGIDRHVEAQKPRFVTFGSGNREKRELDLYSNIPCFNSTHATSELGNVWATKAPFVILWFQRHDGKYVYSLRSVGDFDVSAIAKAFGGGGHKNAAGFTLDRFLF